MVEIKRILNPTDFSDSSKEGTDFALEFAERFDAELHLLHVVHDVSTQIPDFGMGLAFPGFAEKIPERMRKHEEAAIRGLTELTPEGWSKDHSVVLAVKQGQPFVEVIRYARSHDIDLIVMGTHGRSGLAHALLGSVAERVVQKSPCPVLTIRPSDHEFQLP